MREFESGATRDDDDGKLEHWGFASAVVEKRYSEYMHTHRIQADGKLRASNNWTKGIPSEAYKHSLSRHLNDLRLILEGFPELAEDADLETVLCAVKFNVDGLLYETIKQRLPQADEPARGSWCSLGSGLGYEYVYPNGLTQAKPDYWHPEDEEDDDDRTY